MDEEIVLSINIPKRIRSISDSDLEKLIRYVNRPGADDIPDSLRTHLDFLNELNDFIKTYGPGDRCVKKVIEQAKNNGSTISSLGVRKLIQECIAVFGYNSSALASFYQRDCIEKALDVYNWALEIGEPSDAINAIKLIAKLSGADRIKETDDKSIDKPQYILMPITEIPSTVNISDLNELDEKFLKLKLLNEHKED